jgi:hypothetical protein
MQENMFAPDSVYYGKELSVSDLYENLVYLYLVNKDLSLLSREHFCMQQEDCTKYITCHCWLYMYGFNAK